MKYEYDATHDQVSYNYFRCDICGTEFFGGGEAIHKRGCTEKGYDTCVFVFGPKHIEKVKEIGAEHPDQPWWGLTLNILRELFPQLVENAE